MARIEHFFDIKIFLGNCVGFLVEVSEALGLEVIGLAIRGGFLVSSASFLL